MAKQESGLFTTLRGLQIIVARGITVFMGSFYDTLREDWYRSIWINGKLLTDDGDRLDEIHKWQADNVVLKLLSDMELRCPYCKIPLQTSHRVAWDDDAFDEEAHVASCLQCS